MDDLARLAAYHHRAASILSDPNCDKQQKEDAATHRRWARMITAIAADIEASAAWNAAITANREINEA